jgi:hypothetical protein
VCVCIYYYDPTSLYKIYVCNKNIWEELIAYFPLIRRETHRKHRVQHLYCIRYSENVFTEPLPSNGRLFWPPLFRLSGLISHSIQKLLGGGHSKLISWASLYFLAYFPYFEKVSLWDHLAVCLCIQKLRSLFSLCFPLKFCYEAYEITLLSVCLCPILIFSFSLRPCRVKGK